ncbi:hypothetical protein L3X38_033727 [Prunus dulcis]|uniref:Uncharacterized protein n=1 Tax=Prunus dulcis TaxID=3755 RepID=A0AAD4YX77_PRUDU|nr:hypothetical protein L3X38_033727 [Prunus dulcis]
MLNSTAALLPNPVTPSEIMQVTGGISDNSPSLTKSSLKGPRQFFLMESLSAGTSWIASLSDGGSPFGMASNLKPGKPVRDDGCP